MMLGGMLAGHDQSGGEEVVKDGKKYKMFYGMSSSTAMNKYAGGVRDYRSVCRDRSLDTHTHTHTHTHTGPQKARRCR